MGTDEDQASRPASVDGGAVVDLVGRGLTDQTAVQTHHGMRTECERPSRAKMSLAKGSSIMARR